MWASLAEVSGLAVVVWLVRVSGLASGSGLAGVVSRFWLWVSVSGLGLAGGVGSFFGCRSRVSVSSVLTVVCMVCSINIKFIMFEFVR